MVQVGFRARNPLAYRALNFCVALVLILLTLPFFIAISLALLITQGPGIFYRGARLGKDKKRFGILKFRTLCPRRAEELTRECTLPRDARIETPLGRALRDSRLDELPQLINILKGDMNLCGPRPVRPEIAAIERGRIKDYDRRFTVKPGLVGTTQACFGHSTSKRIRARMNNRLATRPVSITAEFALLASIGFSIAAKIGSELAGLVVKAATGAKPVRRADMWLADERGTRLGALDRIEDGRFAARGLSSAAMSGDVTLHVRLRSGKLRKARLTVSPDIEFGVYRYSPRSEYSMFIIERYALGLVVLQPDVKTLPVDRDGRREWAPGLRLSRS
jgi:lipopolysaccharide/colanic/teichoic acid biosynthesis glycosyltransferase